MSAILNAAAATAAVLAPHAPSVRQRPGILLTRGRSRCAAVKAQVVSNGGGGWTLKSSSSPSTAVGASATSPGLRQRWSAPDSRRSLGVASSAASAAAPASSEGGDTGESAAIVNTIKAIFGAGGFALPWAFAQGGTILVSLCLAVSCVFALESLKMLVKAQDVLVEVTAPLDACVMLFPAVCVDELTVRLGKVVEGLADVQTYAGLTKAAVGPFGDVLCKVLNVITCFGITVSYLIFVSDTAISILPKATAATFTTAKMITMTTPLWLALSWLRSFKGVNFISLMGTISVALGMTWVMVVALSNPLQIAAIPTSNPAAFSGFFGTVAFLFFIHFTLFSVQEAMPQPKKFVPAVSKAFFISMIVSCLFGTVGAFGFGPGVKSVVITMLDGAAGTAVKALLCVNLLFTFPLMARSCLVILENAAKGSAAEVSTPASLGIRSAFVVFAALLACNVPNFGTVLGLVGGVCCCAMTLAMPPWILHQSMKKAAVPVGGFEMAKISVVCFTGLVCMALSVVL